MVGIGRVGGGGGKYRALNDDPQPPGKRMLILGVLKSKTLTKRFLGKASRFPVYFSRRQMGAV